MLRRGDSLRERWRGSDRSFTTRTPGEERESLQRNTLRRSFSRKIRRYVKQVSSPAAETSARLGLTKAQSLSSLPSRTAAISDLQIPRSNKSSRKVERSDFLVCWFGREHRLETLPLDSERPQDLDILSRLEVRVYTRHLARLVLSFMTEKDLSVMLRVSRQWRRFLTRELRPALFCRIRNLQIVE